MDTVMKPPPQSRYRIFPSLPKVLTSRLWQPPIFLFSSCSAFSRMSFISISHFKTVFWGLLLVFVTARTLVYAPSLHVGFMDACVWVSVCGWLHGDGAESMGAGFSITHSAQGRSAIVIGALSTLTLLKTQGKGDVVFLSCHSVSITDSSSDVQYFNGTLMKLLTLTTAMEKLS